MPEDADYCSDGCRDEAKAQFKNKNRKTMYFYAIIMGAMFVMWIAFAFI